jgi:signal transduction histidine kinase
VARHAGAGHLWLQLDGAGDRLDLEIRDDGVGFEPLTSSTLVRDGRFGLITMQERVEMAGGRFQVNTRPGAGVTVRAMFRRSRAA